MEDILAISGINAPKPVIRKSFQTRIIDKQKSKNLLQMIAARNRASHTYIEEISEKPFNLIPDYYKLINNIATRLNPNKL